MSDVYALTLGCLVVGFTAVAWLVNRRLAASVVLHNLGWAAGLLVVGSGLMNYVALSATAWLVITGAIAAFNFGAWVLVTRRGRPDRATSPSPADEPVAGASVAYVSLPVYWSVFALFNVGLVLYLWTISRLYGLSTLLYDPVAIRGDSQVNYMEAFPVYGKALFYLAPLSFVLTVFPGLVRGLRDRPAFLRYGILAWLILAQAATLQRTNIFVTLVWALGIYLLARAAGPLDLGVRFRARHVGAVLLVALVVFQGIALVLGKTGTSNPHVRYAVDPVLRDSSLTGVLHYAGGGIPAFGLLVESRNDAWPPVQAKSFGDLYGDYNPQTWGAATLAAPLDMVPGAPHWREIAPNVRLPAPTNVYTWLEPWYRDFRIPGAIGGSLLAGCLAGFFMRRRLPPAQLLLGGLLVGATGLAVFVNRLTSTMTLVLIVAIGVLYLVRLRTAGAPDAARRAVTASERARPAA